MMQSFFIPRSDGSCKFITEERISRIIRSKVLSHRSRLSAQQRLRAFSGPCVTQAGE